MANKFQKMTSGVLATGIIFVIIIAFALEGYQTGFNSADTVGKVGPLPIKAREYQRQFGQLSNRYRSILRKEHLTSKEIKDFRLKEQTIDSIVSQKLMILLADKLGYIPSDSELSEQIKKMPTFQNKEKKFDLMLYNNLLLHNDYTKNEFEDLIRDDLKASHSSKLLMDVSLSDGFVSSIEKIKNNKIEISAIQFNKNDLRKHLSVSDKEINSFVKKAENEKSMQDLFEQKKSSLGQDEEVKARHILIKASNPAEFKRSENKINAIAKEVTAKNFIAKANLYTQDPSGKGKGGSLGWFKRGKMVKEFDAVAFATPVGSVSKVVKTNFGFHLIYVEDKKEKIEAKLKDHKRQLAKELILKGQNDKLESFVTAKIPQFKAILKKGQKKALTKLSQKYSLKNAIKRPISQIDSSVGAINLGPSQIKEVFAQKADNWTFNEGQIVTLVHFIKKVKSGKAVDKRIETQKNAYKYRLSSKLRNDVLAQMKKDIKVVTYKNLL